MVDRPLMLSLSGMRGLVGQSLTPPVAARYAAAFGQWLRCHATADAAPHVVLGRDSRPSGTMIEMAAVSGLLGVGCCVTCLGIVTTPSVAIMTRQSAADGGVVITASHNPIAWNGIKTLNAEGAALPHDQAQQIINRFQAEDVAYVPVEGLTELHHNDSTHHVHIERILEHIDVDTIRRGKLKIVLDSVHGAGGPATALLLQELGVELVHLFAEPTGWFPHPPEPTRDHLATLCRAVQEQQADIGFAQDPDADRLAVVDEKGQHIGEEYTLALAALHVLAQAENAQDGMVVTNLSTSRMIDDIATEAGAQVLRTPVGEANVAATIRASGALIGGEGNGGVIWPDVVNVRDSLTGIALILEMLTQRAQPVSMVVEQVPRYAIAKDKADIPEGMAQRLVPIMQAHFTDQAIDLQDGVRVDWPDRWVHVRPSNTEPIMRIIAEARDQTTAWRLIGQVRNILGIDGSSG